MELASRRVNMSFTKMKSFWVETNFNKVQRENAIIQMNTHVQTSKFKRVEIRHEAVFVSDE